MNIIQVVKLLAVDWPEVRCDSHYFPTDLFDLLLKAAVMDEDPIFTF